MVWQNVVFHSKSTICSIQYNQLLQKRNDPLHLRIIALALREAEGITKGRAVITEQSIRKWLDDLKSFLNEEHALDVLEDPERIFNGDDTSFLCAQKLAV